MSNELRAYDPTWRDRVAAALIGEGKPSRYYRDVISGLVGSAGIGGTGYSLSDLTPAGTVFSADEMVRSARDGNYGQAALDAASIIPAGVAFRAAAKFAKGARPFANFAAESRACLIHVRKTRDHSTSTTQLERWRMKPEILRGTSREDPSSQDTLPADDWWVGQILHCHPPKSDPLARKRRADQLRRFRSVGRPGSDLIWAVSPSTDTAVVPKKSSSRKI
jgi:hypothetical protein